MTPGPNERTAQWLARLQNDDLPAEEQSEFERWLQSDPANAVAFARAEFAWERADRLRALPEQFRKRSLTAAEPHSRAAKARRWLIAASLVAIVTGGLGWYLAARTVYSTAIGERRTVTLQDGSQINLNTSSRLEVHFDERKREVRLFEGEALFKVERQAQRPFVVVAGNTLVTAIGTAFNVRFQDQVVEVTVTEGSVAVSETSRVEAGAALVVAAGAVERVALSEDAIQRKVAWKEGVIELRGETLEQAVQEFNRYQKNKLVVADPAIASLRVGGRFETDEVEKFIKALGINFAIRAIEGAGGSVYLLGAEGAPALPEISDAPTQ